MLGTENGRYDVPEDAHLVLLCRCPPLHRIAGWCVRMRRGALWVDCRCVAQIAVRPVTGMCKHRAFREVAAPTMLSYLRNRVVVVSRRCGSTDWRRTSGRRGLSVF